jgi:CHAD domain-containing protein
MAIRSDPTKCDEASARPVDQTELVHETRKAIKRMRALARLLRNELGEQEFKRVNGSLRHAGRRLAGARDAEVRLATLEQLRARHSSALDSQGIERLRRRLELEREQAGEPSSPEEVIEDIADMRRQLARWNLVAPDLQALAPGLERIYREGRRRYAHVKHEQARDPEYLHDWRKRVKALYYALDTLGGLDAKGARLATRRANRIGDLLGEEHDLWMLCAYVERRPDIFGGNGGAAAHEELLKLSERRRKYLRKRALKLGGKLYRRKASAFTRLIARALSR